MSRSRSGPAVVGLRLHHQPFAHLTLVCLVLLVGAGLRFYDLGSESYWFDEVITVQMSRDGLSAVIDSFARVGRPPVHLLLTSLWMGVAGTTEFSTRYLSAFAGTVSIAVIYVIGRQLFCRRVGLVSATLMALSEFQILYSQETRYYALFSMFTLLSFLSYVTMLGRGGHFLRGYYIAATVLMCYSHTYGVLVVLAQGLHFLVQSWLSERSPARPEWRLWLATQLIILAALAPVLYSSLPGAVQGASGPMSWIDDPPLSLVGVTILRFIGSRYPVPLTVLVAGIFLGGVSLTFHLFAGGATWRESAVALARSLRRLICRRSELTLLGLWLLCPLLIPWTLSKLLGPMYEMRYVSSAAPALYLLLAVGGVTIRQFVPEPAILGFVVILIAPGLHEYYKGVTKEDWRGAAAYVERRAEPGDVVVFPGRPFGRFAFDWYYEGSIQECEVEISRRDSAAVIGAAIRCAGEASRMWLVFRAFPFDGTGLEEADWRAAGLRLVERRDFRGVPVHLFERVGADADAGKWAAPQKGGLVVPHLLCRPRMSSAGVVSRLSAEDGRGRSGGHLPQGVC